LNGKGRMETDKELIYNIQKLRIRIHPFWEKFNAGDAKREKERAEKE
jgi:hypothetical protein